MMRFACLAMFTRLSSSELSAMMIGTFDKLAPEIMRFFSRLWKLKYACRAINYYPFSLLYYIIKWSKSGKMMVFFFISFWRKNQPLLHLTESPRFFLKEFTGFCQLGRSFSLFSCNYQVRKRASDRMRGKEVKCQKVEGSNSEWIAVQKVVNRPFFLSFFSTVFNSLPSCFPFFLLIRPLLFFFSLLLSSFCFLFLLQKSFCLRSSPLLLILRKISRLFSSKQWWKQRALEVRESGKGRGTISRNWWEWRENWITKINNHLLIVL